MRVPPPLVPSSLMASWLAKGPPGMDCVACSRVVAVSGPRSVWMAPWLTRTTRDDDAQREQDPHHAAHEVDPEVADGGRAATGQAADQGDGHAEADGGGHEVLHRQARHLREVAHRVLAGVVLPVRVGHEADRRVERERLGHRADVGGVEGQGPLEALQGVEHEHRHPAEGEEGVGVGAPALLAVGVDAAQAVDRAARSPRTPDRRGPSPRRRTRRRGTARGPGCPTAMHARSARSWSQAAPVTSEPLGGDQRGHEVGRGEDGEQEAEPVVERHRSPPPAGGRGRRGRGRRCGRTRRPRGRPGRRSRRWRLGRRDLAWVPSYAPTALSRRAFAPSLRAASTSLRPLHAPAGVQRRHDFVPRLAMGAPRRGGRCRW